MKYKKEELLHTINLLERMNRIIAGGMTGQNGHMGNALADCQAAAIEMGNYLDTLGEQAEPTIRLLEDYCENIYQQSINLNNKIICREISKRISRQLDRLKKAVRYELPEDRKEVVFLPYKASMWDSLESVWEAAEKDDSFDVYVIPVPYYEKNSDGSLGTMIYEGNQYPEYVPVTNWQEYRMEEHRPDIVFIHNPYDSSNYVTSVHPDFYSQELKKYTDLLVYIPYFIGIDGKVAEHFCTTPGVLYADKVIVESEKVKKIYVRAIKKAERENHCAGIFGNPEKKILALGSPKLDRIRSLDIKRADIPKEWSRLIYDKSGKKKKVVFYNTTVNALLNNSDIELKKTEKILNWFKHENRAVLLWRPHPLVISTLKSMRTELYSRYMYIVSQYRDEGWGIYDDSADLERAILVSDAYYGDSSSVTELYKATGKPILIRTYEDIKNGQ